MPHVTRMYITREPSDVLLGKPKLKIDTLPGKTTRKSRSCKKTVCWSKIMPANKILAMQGKLPVAVATIACNTHVKHLRACGSQLKLFS